MEVSKFLLVWAFWFLATLVMGDLVTLVAIRFMAVLMAVGILATIAVLAGEDTRRVRMAIRIFLS